jgi:hypothetical protein
MSGELLLIYFKNFMSLDIRIRSTIWQGCGSGSQLDLDLIGSVDPDPDPEGQKLPTKEEKFFKISCFDVFDVLF